MVNPNRYMNFNEICENVKYNMLDHNKTPFSFDMFTCRSFQGNLKQDFVVKVSKRQ